MAASVSAVSLGCVTATSTGMRAPNRVAMTDVTDDPAHTSSFRLVLGGLQRVPPQLTMGGVTDSAFTM